MPPRLLQNLANIIAGNPDKGKDTSKVKQDAVIAYASDVMVTHCPYEPGTDQHGAWMDGFNQQAWKDIGADPPKPDKPKGILG